MQSIDLKRINDPEDGMTDVLYPITPAYTTRYATDARSKTKSMDIPAGVFRATSPNLPDGWRSYIQPEGKIYFEGGTNMRIVTDAYMYTQETHDKVVRCAAIAAKLIEARNIFVPDSAELYLLPDNDGDGCYYYFADHASHSIFWLQPVNSDNLCIPDTVSHGNLEHALKDLYWQHLEQFPSHRFDRLHLAIDELLMAFVHGEADHRTSRGSTFPYDAKECKHFTRILQLSKEKPNTGESVFIVARLWYNVVRHRQQIHYAEERTRLDRLQKIIESSENDGRSFFFSAASRLLLGVPSSYAKKFEDASSDDIIYLHIWGALLTKSKEDWNQHFTWSLVMAIINILSLLVPGSSGPLVTLSLGCCAITAIASLTLLNRHANTSVHTCDEAVPFLYNACHDPLRRAALAFGAPRAFFLYAVILAAAQPLLWLERATNLYVVVALGALVVLASLPWGRWARRVRRALPTWRRRRYVDVDEEAAADMDEEAVADVLSKV